MRLSENEEYTIAPGGEKTLFTVLGWGARNASLILNNLQVEICYESIYEQSFVARY